MLQERLVLFLSPMLRQPPILQLYRMILLTKATL